MNLNYPCWTSLKYKMNCMRTSFVNKVYPYVNDGHLN